MKRQKVKCLLRGFEKIPNFEGYFIDRFGNVFSEFQGKILKPFKRSNYLTVRLQEGKDVKNCLLHRLVAQTFIPNPDNLPEIDHIDGDTTNNIVENLRWVTRKQNQNNPISADRRKKSITEKQGVKVAAIHNGKVFKEFDSISEAARKMKLQATNICKVLHGKLLQTGGYNWKVIKNEEAHD